MRKWTALLLALVMCFSLCACKNGSKDNTADNTEYETMINSMQEIDHDKAEEYASSFVKSSPETLGAAAGYYTAKVIDIGSVDVRDFDANTNNTDYKTALATVKGTFYACDAYGQQQGKYSFDWLIPVFLIDGQLEIDPNTADNTMFSPSVEKVF